MSPRAASTPEKRPGRTTATTSGLPPAGLESPVVRPAGWGPHGRLSPEIPGGLAAARSPARAAGRRPGYHGVRRARQEGARRQRRVGARRVLRLAALYICAGRGVRPDEVLHRGTSVSDPARHRVRRLHLSQRARMVRRARRVDRDGTRGVHRALHVLRSADSAGVDRSVHDVGGAARADLRAQARRAVVARRRLHLRRRDAESTEHAARRRGHRRRAAAHAPRAARARARRGPHHRHVARGDSQRRRLTRVVVRVLARRAELLHRQQRDRDRILPSAARHHAEHRRTGARRPARGPAGARTAAQRVRSVRLLLRAGVDVDSAAPGRRADPVSAQARLRLQRAAHRAALQLSVLRLRRAHAAAVLRDRAVDPRAAGPGGARDRDAAHRRARTTTCGSRSCRASRFPSRRSSSRSGIACRS